VQSRAADAGRDEDSIAFFIGIVPIVAPTEAEAEAKYEALKESVDVESTLALLSGFLDMDLSELDPDQKVEHIETQAIQGTMNAFTQSDPDRDWTVREVAEFSGLGSTSPIVVGTPEQVADELVYWYEAIGVDGFNVKEAVRTGSLDDFVDQVVPELQDRGLFRTEYEGETLRERLYSESQSRLPADHPGRR
jgi:alkanesulfonate monooxygenase SsuD/methylene tetrahydromethanopterin reductase-like flavin-dependent oxidoreductase (luciferase family)